MGKRTRFASAALLRPMELRVLTWPPYRGSPQPYGRLLYSELSRLGASIEELSAFRLVCHRYDILHLHWPESMTNRPSAIRSVLRAVLFMAAVASMRLRGTKVVWTVHNLTAHDSRHPALERIFLGILARQTDAFMVFESGFLDDVRKRYRCLRSRPGFVTSIGDYRSVFPGDLDRATARAEFGLSPDQVFLLHFGGLRAYKNIPELLRVFSEWEAPNARLMILASVHHSFSDVAEIEAAAAKDERISIRLCRFSDDELARAAAAADVCIFPFRDIWNSSSVLTALSLGVPVVAPRMGSIPDMAESVGSDWIFLYDPPLTTGMLDGLVRLASSPKGANRPDLSAFGWDEIGNQTAEAFRCVMGLRRARIGRSS